MAKFKVALTTKDRKVLQRVIDLLRTEADELGPSPVRDMWRKRAARLHRVLTGKLNAQSAGDMDTDGVPTPLVALTLEERESIARVWDGVGQLVLEDHKAKCRLANPWAQVSMGTTLTGITSALHARFPRLPEWPDGEPDRAPVTIPAVYLDRFHEWALSYRDTYADCAEDPAPAGPKYARMRWAHEVVLDQLNDDSRDSTRDTTVMVPTGPDGAGSFLAWLQDESLIPSSAIEISDYFTGDKATREEGRAVLDGFLSVIDQMEAICGMTRA